MQTPEMRKQCNQSYLQGLGAPVNIHLPVRDDSISMRSASDVAGRAIVTLHVTAAGHGDPRDVIKEYLRTEGLWKHIGVSERHFLEAAEPTQEEYFAAQWRLESLPALLWALGAIDELALPNELCDVKPFLPMLPDPRKSTASFTQTAGLRSRDEILDMLDLVYRMHWITRDEYVNNGPNPLNFNEGILAERHRALGWIVADGTGWDDVDVST